VIVFVHNPDVDGDELLYLARFLLKSIGEEPNRRASATPCDDRWLVLVDNKEPSIAEAIGSSIPAFAARNFKRCSWHRVTIQLSI